MVSMLLACGCRAAVDVQEHVDGDMVSLSGALAYLGGLGAGESAC